MTKHIHYKADVPKYNAAALEVIAISATAKMYARIAHSVWTGQVMCGSLGSYVGSYLFTGTS